MVKSAKKAFTLVELIVVITILAILGTIAFISLQGYSAEARDSKRLSNVNDLTRKINIEIVRGTHPSKLIKSSANSGSGDLKYKSGATDWTVSSGGTMTRTDVLDAQAGVVDFVALKENGENFRDPAADIVQDYPFAFAIGGTGSGAYNFLQMGTVNESKNYAVLVGNYFQMENMPVSLIEAGNVAEMVIDKGSVYPYRLSQ